MYLGMAAFRYSEEGTGTRDAMVLFETLFFVNMLVNFVLTYSLNSKNSYSYVETDISKISTRYIKTGFMMDVIPLIPLQIFEMSNGRHNLFYLIKVVRLYKGFIIFDVHYMMHKIKDFYK